MTFRRLLGPIAAAAAAVVMLACSGNPSSTPAGANAVDGEEVPTGIATVAASTAVEITTASGEKLTVTVSALTTGVASGNRMFAPKRGQFVTVTAEVRFVSGPATTYLASPVDFKLVDADGTVYDAEVMTSIEPLLPTTNLNRGQKASGKVVFDVPESVTKGSAQVQFNGSWDGKAAAFWTV